MDHHLWLGQSSKVFRVHQGNPPLGDRCIEQSVTPRGSLERPYQSVTRRRQVLRPVMDGVA